MAVTFFWRAEAETLSGVDDFSAGDTTGAAAGAAAISVVAAKLGTNGVLAPGSSDFYRFDSSGIYSNVGCMGNWIQWKSAIPNAGLNANGVQFVQEADVANIINFRTLGVSPNFDIRLQIRKTGAVANFVATSGLSVALDTWYFIIGRWDVPGDKCKIEVYNSAGTLITSTEDTGTDLGPFEPSVIDGIRIGNSSSHASNIWFDSIMIANTYAEPLQNYLAYTSYTQISGGGGSAMPVKQDMYRRRRVA